MACSTQKAHYHSERQAREAARRLRSSKGLPFRYYRCKECGLFHMSTGPNVVQQKKNKKKHYGTRSRNQATSQEELEEIARRLRRRKAGGE